MTYIVYSLTVVAHNNAALESQGNPAHQIYRFKPNFNFN